MEISKINLYRIIDILILLLPISFLLGSPYINFTLIVGSIIFLYNSINLKEFSWLKLLWVRMFLIIWVYLIINSFFSSDFYNAFRGSFSFIRFLLFSLLISYYGFKTFSHLKIISFWKFVLLIVLIDILIQFIIGYNILGLQNHGDRYSGFFGNELIAGSYIFKFSSVIIGLSLYQIFINPGSRSKYLSAIVFCLLSFFICLITGERMSFILFFGLISVTIFSLLYYQRRIKFLFIILFSAILVMLILFNSTSSIKSRYFDMANIINNFDQSSYGKLFNSGYRLWQKNPIKGVGIKNFRVECDKQLTDIFPDNPSQLCSTHPHNLYLELLSETGIIGTFLFIAFFVIYFKNILRKKIFEFDKENNCIIYAGIVSSLLIIWPIGTSGSFFTTWNGSYFWIQIGIINYLFGLNKPE